jgi:hypothetical protein
MMYNQASRSFGQPLPEDLFLNNGPVGGSSFLGS